MSSDGSKAAEATLAKRAIHEEWKGNYRTPENEQFYRMAFGHIASVFSAPANSRVMDAGCGSCAKSRHLVDQGFNVLGTDFSDEALHMARRAIEGTAYESRITLKRENLTRIDMPDGNMPFIVCWGVLMHIPDVQLAVAELSRVLAPGGRIAISEGNFRSWQSGAMRVLKSILRRERAEVVVTPAGIEYWEETQDGRLMTRQASIRWLIDEFSRQGLSLVDHRAGQFSELYWLMPSRMLSSMIHWINSIWFRRIRSPGPAFGNLLIFEKPI